MRTARGHRMLSGTVRFDVSREVAFDYLVEPRNRAAWQSSLRRVESVDAGEPRVGQRWVDVTRPGLRPTMRTDRLERPRTWSESGSWRMVTAFLTLDLTPRGPEGCTVTYAFRVDGPGPVSVLGLGLSVLAAPAVGADLRRAARILAGRRTR